MVKQKMIDLEKYIYKLRKDSYNGRIKRHGVVEDEVSWDWGFREALNIIEEKILESKECDK